MSGQQDSSHQFRLSDTLHPSAPHNGDRGHQLATLNNRDPDYRLPDYPIARLLKLPHRDFLPIRIFAASLPDGLQIPIARLLLIPDCFCVPMCADADWCVLVCADLY